MIDASSTSASHEPDRRGFSLQRMACLAWVSLVYNVAVVVWGAYVRATGAGAGCGNHWPLCNGQIVPRAARLETLIEFSHRSSSGLAAILVLAVLVLCWRLLPKRHPARLASMAAFVLMVTEALLGAALVKFHLVAQDRSLARAISLPVHSTNTLLLLAAIALTALWIGVDVNSLRPQRRGGGLVALTLVLFLVTTAAGVVTALGDTLFPAATMAQDFSSSSHFLVRLRVLHPAFAVLTAAVIGALVWRAVRRQDIAAPLAAVIGGALLLHLILGALNIALFAPVWLQLLHLAIADTIWIGLIAITAKTLLKAKKTSVSCVAL